MKNYLLLSLLFTVFYSCDVVETPYMNDAGTTPIDTSSAFVQKILVEDFTGHTCQNCPSAAVELKNLQDLYGDKVIGIAIHSGGFAEPEDLTSNKFTYDFRTAAGNDYYSTFEIVGLPIGLVNRIGYPDNTHKKNWAEWQGFVQSALQKTPKLGITIDSKMNGGRTGNIDISIEVLEELSGLYYLVVCLTENNIINWQKDGANDNEFYEHEHVLRAALGNSWGELLKTDQNFAIGETLAKTYAINLDDLEEDNIDHSLNPTLPVKPGNGNAGGWKKQNMHVVAYVYSANNTGQYEILQVQDAHLNN